MKVEITKVIKHGHLELQIPAGVSESEALKMYSGNYPELAFAELSPPTIVDDKQVYEVKKNASIGTKG